MIVGIAKSSDKKHPTTVGKGVGLPNEKEEKYRVRGNKGGSRMLQDNKQKSPNSSKEAEKQTKRKQTSFPTDPERDAAGAGGMAPVTEKDSEEKES